MRLKELRIKEGYTQKELADKLGYRQNTISQWENGVNFANPEVIIEFANFFGVTTDYLLGRPTSKLSNSDPLQNKLIGVFQNLNDIGKREAIKRITELSQLEVYQSEKMPVAAHNDVIDDNELKLMQQDIDEL